MKILECMSSTSSSTHNHPSVNIRSPQFLYQENPQKPCRIKSNHYEAIGDVKMKQIDRAIRETALANSTFASAILQLSQMNTSAESLNEYITIYNSLQECLSTSISSLGVIKDQLNGKSRGKSFH